MVDVIKKIIKGIFVIIFILLLLLQFNVIDVPGIKFWNDKPDDTIIYSEFDANVGAASVREKVTLEHCIAGDLIKFKEYDNNVKLILSETPSITSSDGATRELAKKATEYTCKQLTEAERIYFAYDNNGLKESDSFDGTQEGYVWVDDSLLNLSLVKDNISKSLRVGVNKDGQEINYDYLDPIRKSTNIEIRQVVVSRSIDGYKYTGGGVIPADSYQVTTEDLPSEFKDKEMLSINFETKEEPKPNVVVKSSIRDSHDYYFTTDAQGRVIGAYTSNLKVKDPNDPQRKANSSCNGRWECNLQPWTPKDFKTGYDRGHLIADSLDGPDNLYNLTVQNSKTNRNIITEYEGAMRDAVKSGKHVSMYQKVIHLDSDNIPEEYQLQYTIDTKTYSYCMKNDGSKAYTCTIN